MSEAYQDSPTLRDVSNRTYWKTSAGARRNSANIRTSCLKHRSEDAWFLDVPCPTMWQETVVPIPPATHRISGTSSGYRIIPGLLDVPRQWSPSLGMFHDHVIMSGSENQCPHFAGDQSSKKKTPEGAPLTIADPLNSAAFHDLPFAVHDAPAPSLVLQFLVGHDPCDTAKLRQRPKVGLFLRFALRENLDVSLGNSSILGCFQQAMFGWFVQPLFCMAKLT